MYSALILPCFWNFDSLLQTINLSSHMIYRSFIMFICYVTPSTTLQVKTNSKYRKIKQTDSLSNESFKVLKYSLWHKMLHWLSFWKYCNLKRCIALPSFFILILEFLKNSQFALDWLALPLWITISLKNLTKSDQNICFHNCLFISTRLCEWLKIEIILNLYLPLCLIYAG